MNTLYIDQLTVMARVGVHHWEKQCLQKLIFDLRLTYNNTSFINQTNTVLYLDYTEINQIILNTVNTKHFLLIEEIAEVVSQKLIERFSIISKIQIRVNKPGAIYNARNVSISIKRKKLNQPKKINLYIGSR